MITFEHVTKRYGKTDVVHDLNLTIPEGTTFGFLGQNGAGKTTTIKMLVGLTEPSAGRITIQGIPTTEARVREAIGFMPEAPYFYDRLTGLEFLRFCGELFSVTRHKTEEQYVAILEMVGIATAKNRAISTYSKGMKQRLGFAQALVNDPKYIFLDEPLDGLDPIGRKEIKEIVRGLKRQGKTVFFNSHILYDTEALCDAIGVIHAGKLLYAGSVKEFCAGKPLEERFVEVVEHHKNKNAQ